MDPADMSGGTGGARPEYPEQWKRERLLWFVHDWIQERHAADDNTPMLDVHEVQHWGEEQEGMNGAQAMHLFKQLVEEGYISTSWLNTGSDRWPWAHAGPQYLTTRGLLEIGELPDPDQKLIAALAATRRMIEQDPGIPEEDKPGMLDTLEKMASLANNVRGLGYALIQGLSQTGG